MGKFTWAKMGISMGFNIRMQKRLSFIMVLWLNGVF